MHAPFRIGCAARRGVRLACSFLGLLAPAVPDRCNHVSASHQSLAVAAFGPTLGFASRGSLIQAIQACYFPVVSAGLPASCSASWTQPPPIALYKLAYAWKSC